MTLPSGGPWPPPPHDIALAQEAIWNAWYVGDPEALSTVYGGLFRSVGSEFFERQGGVFPAVARFFWGRPSPAGRRKARLHVPLAADIATASGDLLFSEPPQFVASEDANDRAVERIDQVLNVGEFHAALLQAAEIAAALGGCFLRLVWDKEIESRVMIDTVPADNAIGEWRFGRLVAVTFFTEYQEEPESIVRQSRQGTIFRHLERHEPGVIYHGLYRGDARELGRAEALSDHPATAPYADLVNEEGAIATGVAGLTAAYVANIRPQRRWRRIEALSELGRSDYDGVEPLMDALDETYTSWMRDVRLGKARLIVPEFYLENLGKGKGAAWDEDQEVFTRLNIAPIEEKNAQITPQQFAIRVQEHKDTAYALVNEILRATGYSPATFGMQDSDAEITATEVMARERSSARTRDKKTRYWEQALEGLLTTWLELDARIFGTGARGQVSMQWPDSSQPDPEALARTMQTLRSAEAASTKTLVGMFHPDWDETEIAAEVEQVMAESGRTVPELPPFPEG